MTILVAIFLGIVQGLTEFLPVSSSGHLILFQSILNLPDDMMLFNIILHIATLLAVLFVFRKRIWQLIRHPFNKTNYALIMATIVTVGFVLLFKDFIDRTMTASVLPITFMITAIVLFSTTFVGREKNKSTTELTLSTAEEKATATETKKSENTKKRRSFFLSSSSRANTVVDSSTQKEISYTSALATGLAQGLAVVPGFSRSGFTISTALATGTSRERAAEFSFLMSIPIIIAALVYELISNPNPAPIAPLPLMLAFVAALVSGIFAIKFMLKLVKKIQLYWFSIYLIVLSIITIFVV